MVRNHFRCGAWLLVVLLAASCHKESYDYQSNAGDQLDVDSIAFSAGSPSLIADGQAALTFITQFYHRQQVMIEGKTSDSMVSVPIERVPPSAIKIVDENGNVVGQKYSTTSVTPSSKTFHAEIGGTSSASQIVSIVAPGAAYAKITIPVIFHVFELNKKDPKHYPWYTYLSTDKLKSLVDGLNAIFNRQGTDAPMGATANMEFVLATQTPGGSTLQVPGYDMYEYPGNFDWGWASYNASQLVKDNATKLFWDPKKYLNIWVLPSAVYYGGLVTGQPMYTLSSTPLDGLSLQEVATPDEVPMTEPESVGLMLGRDEFNSPLRGPAPNLAYRFGTFYGLFHTYTYSWDPTTTDYCPDTQKFDLTQYQQVYKTTPDNILFSASNVMDATFLDYNVENGQGIVSTVNTFTAGQIQRIRYVLENCPERMCWK